MQGKTISSRVVVPRTDAVFFPLVCLMLVAASLSIAVTQICLGLALTLLLLRATAGRERPPRLGLEGPVAALALWAAVMILFSADRGQSLLYYRRFFLFTVVWVTADAARGERRRRLMAASLLAGAGVVSLWGVVHELAADGSFLARRLSAPSNSMTTGALLMMASLVAVSGVLQPALARRTRGRVAAVGLLTLLGLFMTMTRSAWLGFAVGTVVLLAETRPRLALPAAVMGIAAALLLLYAPADALPGRLARMRLGYFTHSFSSRQRVEMWEGGLRMIRDHPVTGVGDHDLAALGPIYYPNPDRRYHGHMHSDLVMIPVIWGLPGLVLAASVLGSQVRVMRRRWHLLAATGSRAPPWAATWSVAVLGVCAALFVAGMTEWYFGDAETQTMYLAVLGTALGIGAVRRDKSY